MTAAEKLVLDWVQGRQCFGMRNMPNSPRCRVLDLLASEPNPDEPNFPRVKRVAVGETWDEVLADLQRQGLIE